MKHAHRRGTRRARRPKSRRRVGAPKRSGTATRAMTSSFSKRSSRDGNPETQGGISEPCVEGSAMAGFAPPWRIKSSRAPSRLHPTKVSTRALRNVTTWLARNSLTSPLLLSST